MTLKIGTMVDATIIAAPSSTRSADKERDLEMHQTRKGKQWYSGMKLHICLDRQSRLAHSAVGTLANVHEKHPLPELLHGRKKRVYGDSAYASQRALMHGKAPQSKDFTNECVRCRMDEAVDESKRAKNRNKSKIRAQFEHVFAVVNRLWGFTKVRSHCMAKNACRAFTALALTNIYLSRDRLMAQARL